MSIAHKKTHPHGKFWKSQDNHVGYLRISKCGSTSFVESIQADEILPFSDSWKCDLLLACIRNPIDRFISSIPETLKRIGTNSSGYGDVIVEQQIYDFLLKSPINSSGQIVRSFIRTIEEFGFFDAHHEPMHHFFKNPDGTIGFDASIFSLNAMNQVISELGYQPRLGNIREIRQERRGNLEHAGKTILGFTRLYYTNPYYRPFHRGSLQKRLLNEWKIYSLNHQEALDTLLRALYKEMKQLTEDDRIHAFVEKHYRTDVELFNAVNDQFNSIGDLKKIRNLVN